MPDRDLEDYLHRIAQRPVSRRSLLQAMGLAGASAAALAACGPGAGSSGGIEDALYLYNWSDYVNPDNIEKFKKDFGIKTFQYDTFANNEELIAKLQGGVSGYDIACPTAEYVPGMVEQGFVTKLDKGRISNLKYIDKAFQGLWWDPNDEYIVPKDYGTTGILYRGKLIDQPTTWRQFYDQIKGEASGKTVFVDSMGDVFVFPLKMLGYSLNSVDPGELEEARQVLLDVAPHLLALDSDTYQDKLATEEASLCLGWTGPLLELRANPDTADTAYSVPEEGTLFWLDVWVLLKDAPHPNASYAWLNFIQDPENQGNESNYNGYATPNDEAKKFVDAELLADPAIFPPDDVLPNLEGAQDTSGNNQRLDIWEEFKSKIGG